MDNSTTALYQGNFFNMFSNSISIDIYDKDECGYFTYLMIETNKLQKIPKMVKVINGIFWNN